MLYVYSLCGSDTTHDITYAYSGVQFNFPQPKYKKGYSSHKTKMTALLECLNLEYVIHRSRGVIAMFQPSVVAAM